MKKLGKECVYTVEISDIFVCENDICGQSSRGFCVNLETELIHVAALPPDYYFTETKVSIASWSKLTPFLAKPKKNGSC